MSSHNEILYLAINRIPFLKPREKLLLAGVISSADEFLRFSRRDLLQVLRRNIRTPSFRSELYVRLAECDKKYLTKANIKYTFYREEGYPGSLAEIYDPPLVLYYRGNGIRQDLPLAAVVGTRKPTGEALMRAYSLGVELSAAHVGVVSGLARGIDTAVHKGTVSIGGYAVAVLGNGIDMVYPAGSKPTALNILKEGGCLASEYPPGVLPQKYHFPERNRIISGLSKAVVVVEAPARSGALITADFALDQGRELFVHSVGLESAAGRGTRSLHEQGAAVIHNAYPVIREVRGAGDEPVPAARPGAQSARPGRRARVDNKKGSGTSLARLMELELDEKLSVYNGDYYWSE
jgi:DNA processing protein